MSFSKGCSTKVNVQTFKSEAASGSRGDGRQVSAIGRTRTATSFRAFRGCARKRACHNLCVASGVRGPGDPDT